MVLIVECRNVGMMIDMDKYVVLCEVCHEVQERVYVDVDDYLTEEQFELLNLSLFVQYDTLKRCEALINCFNYYSVV